MGKSKRKGSSELEVLRGRIRQLEKELKYFKRRSHIENVVISEEEPFEITGANQCPKCKNGAFLELDFHYLVMKKCDSCGYQEKKSKNSKEKS